MVAIENRRRFSILSDGGRQVDVYGHRTRSNRMRYKAGLQDDTRFESLWSKSRTTIFAVQREKFNDIRTGILLYIFHVDQRIYDI